MSDVDDKGLFNNYVTLRGGGGLSDALRSVVKVTLKSVTKRGGGGGQKSPKKALRNIDYC